MAARKSYVRSARPQLTNSLEDREANTWTGRLSSRLCARPLRGWRPSSSTPVLSLVGAFSAFLRKTSESNEVFRLSHFGRLTPPKPNRTVCEPAQRAHWYGLAIFEGCEQRQRQ